MGCDLVAAHPKLSKQFTYEKLRPDLYY